MSELLGKVGIRVGEKMLGQPIRIRFETSAYHYGAAKYVRVPVWFDSESEAKNWLSDHAAFMEFMGFHETAVFEFTKEEIETARDEGLELDPEYIGRGFSPGVTGFTK